MAIGRVRIYRGINPEESTVIGWGASVAGISSDAEFLLFMASRDYELKELGYWAHNGSVSMAHTEVSPSLTEEHIQELGQLCTRIANNILVTDNRAISPNSSLHTNGNGLHIANSW